MTRLFCYTFIYTNGQSVDSPSKSQRYNNKISIGIYNKISIGIYCVFKRICGEWHYNYIQAHIVKFCAPSLTISWRRRAWTRVESTSNKRRHENMSIACRQQLNLLQNQRQLENMQITFKQLLHESHLTQKAARKHVDNISRWQSTRPRVILSDVLQCCYKNLSLLMVSCMPLHLDLVILLTSPGRSRFRTMVKQGTVKSRITR